MQAVRPPGQLAVQPPKRQDWPAGQALPQLPQSVALKERSTQWPRQSTRSGGQTHCPPLQSCPPWQAAPQAPQFLLSVWLSRQWPAQSVRDGAQLPTHWPFEQTSPVGQTSPQLPQSFGALAGSTQTPPQLMSPGGQAQLPFTQIVPLEQRLPHEPQFPSLVLGSMHVLLQSS